MDLGWAVMELAVIGNAFDAVTVCAAPFDHSWVGAVAPCGVGSFGDFVGGFVECCGESFRGKSPPGW